MKQPARNFAEFAAVRRRDRLNARAN